MAKDKEPHIVTIDDVAYDTNNFTAEQALLFQHCVDLDRKIASTSFQLQQLNIGKDAFIKMLKTALETKTEE
jgi:hypothetical protein